MGSRTNLTLPLLLILNLTASGAMEEDYPTQQARKRALEIAVLEDEKESDEQEELEPSPKKPRDKPTALLATHSGKLLPYFTEMPLKIKKIILDYAFQSMSNVEVYRLSHVCQEFRDIILSLAQIRPDYKGIPKLLSKENFTRFDRIIQVINTTKGKNDEESTKQIAAAYFALGDLYLKGTFKTPDYQKAIKYYNLSRKHGYEYADVRKGLMYEEGLGVIKDKVAAELHYKSSGCESREQALYSLAYMYTNKEEEDEIILNYSAAFALYQKLVKEEPSHENYSNLGYLYAKGLGVKKNESLALQLYHKALELGKEDLDGYDPKILYRLGKMYHQGRGALKDVSKALQLLEECDKCSTGLRAAYYLGRIYEEGLGVEKNEEIARQWYSEKALENPPKCGLSFNRLVRMYLEGRGGKSDIPEAIRLLLAAYKRSSLFSNPQEFCLLFLGKKNPESEVDDPLIAQWLEQTAQLQPRFAACLILLGNMYREGRGGKQDESIAERLYAEAKKYG